jgi:large subunit ribosomal protein L23
MGIMDRIKKEKKSEKVSEKQEETKVVAPAKMKTAGSAALKVVIHPLVTEKAAHAQSITNTYAFVVANNANKFQIADAVEELYGVRPAKVRVLNVQGHAVRFGQGYGKRSDYKKAMVTLKKGDSITIHEGV